MGAVLVLVECAEGAVEDTSLQAIALARGFAGASGAVDSQPIDRPRIACLSARVVRSSPETPSGNPR